MNRRNIVIGGGALALAGAGAAYMGLPEMSTMEEYNASVAAMRAALSERPERRDFIRFATLVPNGHNTQPWRFRISDGVDILPDFSRRTPVADLDNSAAENLALAAGVRGRPGNLSFNPTDDGSVVFLFGDGPASDPGMFDAIPRRQSTRATAATIPGIDLVLITDRPQIERVADLVVASNSAQIADAAFVRELRTWLRFSPRQALETRDSLFRAASGIPTMPTWVGPRVFDIVFRADAENDKYARRLHASSGLAVFVSEKDDKDHWVRAERACQRFALQATALGLKHAFVNQPVEVARVRPELASLVGMTGRRPDIVMRFGNGPALPFSARRPVGALLA